MKRQMRCSRCRRRLRRKDSGQWNGVYRDGVAVDLVCPACQTPEEYAEATINQATLDYHIDASGRLRAHPKAATR